MKRNLVLALILGFLTTGMNANAKNAPTNCFIQSFDGHYLTAVGGGGRISDVIHTNATQPKSWERFTLVDLDKGTPIVTYGIRTVRGYYLTAVDGGGRINNVIHSDAVSARDWEEFQLISLGGGWYAIKTFTGNYLTAVNSGGLSTQVADTMHTDARQIRNWEKFRVKCGVK